MKATINGVTFEGTAQEMRELIAPSPTAVPTPTTPTYNDADRVWPQTPAPRKLSTGYTVHL